MSRLPRQCIWNAWRQPLWFCYAVQSNLLQDVRIIDGQQAPMSNALAVSYRAVWSLQSLPTPSLTIFQLHFCKSIAPEGFCSPLHLLSFSSHIFFIFFFEGSQSWKFCSLLPCSECFLFTARKQKWWICISRKFLLTCTNECSAINMRSYGCI